MRTSRSVACLVGLLCLTALSTDSAATNQAPACPQLPFDDKQRVDCHPETGASEDRCGARGCCWRPGQNPKQVGLPFCFYPSNHSGAAVYRVGPKGVEYTKSGLVAALLRSTGLGIDHVGGSPAFQEVRLEVRLETITRLRMRLTIPAQPGRWEPPIDLEGPDEPVPTWKEVDFKVKVTEDPFGIQVVRKVTPNDVLINLTDSLAPALIMADQFLQVAFALPGTTHTYGPGESRIDFPNKLHSWNRVGLWARDQPPVENSNLYGVHNLVIAVGTADKAFGLFLLNSNAQEVAFTPLPSVVYRTIGGILDFFLFAGPSPASVVAQYQELVGRPPIPPYWALGFHLCRYGYTGVDDISATLKRNIDAGIDVDAQWVDIDYMDAFKDWTVNATHFGDLAKFTSDDLHSKLGVKLVLIVDPAIRVSQDNLSEYATYEEGLRMGVFINKTDKDEPIVGRVWPGLTVFPDFSHPAAEAWWLKSAERFHESIPFDGLWIDMNEPASFVDGSVEQCPLSTLNYPPFVPAIADGSLYSRTLCPTARHHDTIHYNRHNLYGYDEAKVTFKVLKRIFPGKRVFLLSRSTFAGSGRYTAHWTGDNSATWSDLRHSVKQMLAFNMLGIPFVGADICGFLGRPNEELCVRWYQLGAFYPFARSHNAIDLPAQDPAAWSKEAIQIIRNAYNWRKRFTPYMYSLFFRAHLNGSMVVRPLAFEFRNYGMHDMTEQFMLGSAILVAPVLHEYMESVDVYLPRGQWIDLYTSYRLVSPGQLYNVQAPLHKIPIFGRAGTIIPVQSTFDRFSHSRNQGLGIYVLLPYTNEPSPSAIGELFWDDGESDPLNYMHVIFEVYNNTFTTSATMSDLEKPFVPSESGKLEMILFFGLQPPNKFVLNKFTELNFTVDILMENMVLNFNDSPIDLTKPNLLEWFY